MPFLALFAPYKRMLEVLVLVAFMAFVTYQVHKFFDSLREEGSMKERAVWLEKDRKADLLIAQRDEYLKSQKEKAEKEKDDAILRLNNTSAALAASLRNRPDRPPTAKVGDAPRAPEVAQGCTGAELYRKDGEFLTGEAARADRLAVELSACYAQYDTAKDTLNKLKLQK